MTLRGTPKAWPDQCCLSGCRLGTEEVWVLGGLERRGVDDGRTMGGRWETVFVERLRNKA
jgi:hypothetical protein